jgi:hypothetical protein
MSGEHPISGEFSYLVDDEETGEETREASAGPTMIVIDGGATADNGSTGDTGNTGDNGDNGTAGDGGNTGDNGDNGTAGDGGNTADNGDNGTAGDGGNTGDNGDNGTAGDTGDNTPPVVVTCERTVTKQSDDKFKVEVTINKSTASGFARLKEDVPAGFTALEGESASGRFSFKDNAVKYVWTMLPSAEQLTITYTLQADGDISGSFDLNGTLSYVENNETKKVLFGPTSFEVAPPAVADNGTGDTGDNGTGDTGDHGTGDTGDNGTGDTGDNGTGDTGDNGTGDTADNGTGDTGDNGTGDTGDNNTGGVVTTPNPENGIAYRVQVLAAHKVVDDNYFAKKFSYNGSVNLENHEGWTKYTVGSFTQYTGARDERETLTNAGHGFPGPFVAAYNDGARVTVQEALMVSNQQWQQ